MKKNVLTFLFLLVWGGVSASETWEHLSLGHGGSFSLSPRSPRETSYQNKQKGFFTQRDSGQDRHRVDTYQGNLVTRDLLSLPDEVLRMAVSYLDTRALLNFRAVSSKTASIVEAVIRERSPVKLPLLCLMQPKLQHSYPYTVSFFIRQSLWKLGGTENNPKRFLEYANFCRQWNYVGEQFFRMMACAEDNKKLLETVKNWSDVSGDIYADDNVNLDLLEIKLWWYVAQLRTGLQSHSADLRTQISYLLMNILEVVHWMPVPARKSVACFYINELGLFLSEHQYTDLAKRLWGVSAHYGHPLGEYHLAEILEGEGQIKAAKRYYQRSAKQGFLLAYNSLGILYMQEENWDRAKEQIQKAADQGLDDAQYNLSIILRRVGDLRNAKKYLLMAASQGYAYAHFDLSILYQEEGALETAQNHCKIAAEQGLAEAQCNWGVYLYRAGKLGDAKDYLQSAAEQGYPCAQKNLYDLFGMEVQIP